MSDTSVKKVDSAHAPEGDMGQRYLASGKRVALRYWDKAAGADKAPRTRPYETVGYVLEGRAELHLEGQKVLLNPGDAWVVPEGAAHTYKILEPFKAVEATAPPARVDDRDDPA